jgi:glycosyltransferase involved in cell wall biosynthesis
MTNYIIISPVRNEEEYISDTINSVLNQTIKPKEWIIVNDGSTDSTKEIIERYMQENPWIKLVNLQDRGYYYPGTGVVNVIKEGCKNISSNGWDYIAKLDCDVSFDENYFDFIFREFSANDKLGIASGAIHLIDGNKTIKEKSQYDHPWGASKVYRAACFKDIDGWKPIPGWDLADLLSAQMKGWETRCFDEFKIFHHRESGSRRVGFTSGKLLLGRFLYRYGYNFFYTILKGIARLNERPYIIGGLSLIVGYVYAFLRNEDKLFDKDMRKFLRKKQFHYLMQKIKRLFR